MVRDGADAPPHHEDGSRKINPARINPASVARSGATLMTETDSELERLLPQRSFGSLHDLRKLGDRRLGFGMLFQQSDVGNGVGLARRCFLLWSGHINIL